MTGSIRMRHLGLMILAFVFCAAFLVGCGGGAPSKENADKIKTDMSKEDVEKILGKGTELTKEDFKKASGQDIPIPDNMKIVRWGSDDKNLTVTFLDNKVKGIFRKNL